MRAQTIVRFGLAALTIATAALGCTRQDTLRVVVPTGFTGHVTVPCIGVMDGNRTIAVPASGRAQDVTCPKDETHVVIMRDGVIVPTAGSITWAKTGDGIPVGLEFDVK
ncbi:hypothetical protein SAMN05421771_0123 [Granulicella pectinivorans]|jgi:hypothetical protein|uniref:Lipoprotein n=1 Tax=Granulicella pectinivorans TaxID=474950 RepID=A0A1I6L1M2_9BACT|nr:hypothetical protein [Granulicella pectinivorans]SFR97369.1 hypothetical protein SAMN05421771_0123 [Granulicella pectinivorans]